LKNIKTSRIKLKNSRPRPETASFCAHACLLPLVTEDATSEEKNEMLPRWAAQQKPKQTNLVCQSLQSKQTSSRSRYWNSGQSLPPRCPSPNRTPTPQATLILILKGKRRWQMNHQKSSPIKSRGGHRTKRGETLFWQKGRRFPPAIDIAFPLIHPDGPTQSALRGH
jgi:hypothetical protein